eukprot:scaffold222512_cov19-Tisochrysis_lutea.AAC.1
MAPPLHMFDQALAVAVLWPLQERHIPPENAVRRAVHSLLYNNVTEGIIMAIIVCNTIIMLFAHHGMNNEWKMAIDYTNIIVTGVFVVEMVL